MAEQNPMTRGRQAAATRARNQSIAAAGRIRAGRIAGGGQLSPRRAAAARAGAARAGGGQFQGPMPARTGARAANIFRASGVTATGG